MGIIILGLWGLLGILGILGLLGLLGLFKKTYTVKIVKNNEKTNI